jgi:PASTA domain-containing protein
MSWIGRKKLALIPLYRPHAFPPDTIPADWPNLIMGRLFFDPDSSTGVDRSLRAYIRSVSSGAADLDAVVFPMETVDEQDVPPDVLEGTLGAQLRSQGFDAAAIVMLGGVGAGTTRGFWSRFVMLEGVGVWAMEFMHGLTGFGDLYPFDGNMFAFDEMACACATHPSAYTKAAIGWLNASTVAQHPGGVAHYNLYSVGLVQPPPSGRVAAVRLGQQVPYLIVEARQRVDEFDRGISSEGVIVYRIQTTDPLGHAQNNTAPVELLTTTALTLNQTFTSDTGITVTVTAALPGGFSVSIDDATHVRVPDVVGLPTSNAATRIKAVGLVPAFDTRLGHTVVFSQSPKGGSVVARGSTVTLVLHSGPDGTAGSTGS